MDPVTARNKRAAYRRRLIWDPPEEWDLPPRFWDLHDNLLEGLALEMHRDLWWGPR